MSIQMARKETLRDASKILVADDASVMRESLREILRHSDYRVVGEANDGIEVIELFDQLRPEVVVLDLVMPGRSGIDALREILDIDPGTRVVMCSALGQDELVAEALHEGASGFLVKPFSPARTLRTLDRITNRVRRPVIEPSIAVPSATRRAVDHATSSARRLFRALRPAPEDERSKAA